MDCSSLIDPAQKLLDLFRKEDYTFVSVESCTGGMVSAVLTSLPGSSDVLDRAFVTYSNPAKEELVGVPEDLLIDYGAVSEPVARAMAEGGLEHSWADVSVSLTGIAGPDGGTDEKPCGLVYIACAFETMETIVERHVFAGERHMVRLQAAQRAMELATEVIMSKLEGSEDQGVE